jgi:hypothetical protein
MKIKHILLIIIVSFFAVYTIFWNIFEPIPESIFNHPLQRFIIICAFSLIAVGYVFYKRGYYYFIWVRHIKTVFTPPKQSLGLGRKDDLLTEEWKHYASQVPMQPKTKRDDMFGNVAYFDHTTQDAIKVFNAQARETGTIIEWILKPEDGDPVIYFRVEVRKLDAANSNSYTEKWITMQLRPPAPGAEHSEEEEIINIQSKAICNKWMYFSEDLKTTFENIQRWRTSYVFSKIVSIKVRNKFEMALIRVY